MPFSQTLLLEYDEEIKNTRKLLERVPDGKFDYQPHPKSMTMGRLASHIAELPAWTLVLEMDVFELKSDYKPQICTTRAELLKKFDQGASDARIKIAEMSNADWQKTWTFIYDGNTIMSMPRAAVMRSTIMNHLVHHRAQLGVYLRLNGVEIPGMYGPSADEAQFVEAQTA